MDFNITAFQLLEITFVQGKAGMSHMPASACKVTHLVNRFDVTLNDALNMMFLAHLFSIILIPQMCSEFDDVDHDLAWFVS